MKVILEVLVVHDFQFHSIEQKGPHPVRASAYQMMNIAI
jgi:hypothetical protein